MNNEKYTFNDVLIEPAFNTVRSRKDVSLNTKFGNLELSLPIISANMDTVTGVKMAKTLTELGAVGCLHRFCDVETTVQNALETGVETTVVSIGLGEKELTRAMKTYDVGVRHFCIDVAHGASMAVAEQLQALKRKLPDSFVIVGNFASVKSLNDFLTHCFLYKPDAIKVGVGPGSVCKTRTQTGIGYPQLSAIKELSRYLKHEHPYYCDAPGGESSIKLIADGGMKTPGDIAKALAAGADICMLGGMLAATYETPVVQDSIRRHELKFTEDLSIMYNKDGKEVKNWKLSYRGSASKESYQDQGKDDSWRTAEGEAILTSYKGSVKDVLQDIEGGLRSSLTYVGAKDLDEFRKKAKFIRVSGSTQIENGVYSK